MNWLINYRERREFSFPFPVLPTVELGNIDLWLQRTWQVWATIILECIKYGNRDGLEHAYSVSIKNRNQSLSEDENSDEYLRRIQELPDFEEWDAEDLYILDSDRWPESMLKGVFGFVENLLSVPPNKRLEEADHIIGELQELFSSLPRWEGRRESLIKELLELLNLPIWKKRHELYQTWVLTQIDKALKDYQRTIHHVDGRLILSFSGTHIGAVETEMGRLHIWSELRSPLDNPVGKGRSGNIQPDYSLTFEPITSPSQTIVAIECKQYRKANSRNFADALTDYASGRPKSKVILVNYGGIPESVLDRVDDTLRMRTSAIGNFKPDGVEEFDSFKRILLESVPKPVIIEKEIQGIPNEMQFALVAVDISSSMSGTLNNDMVLKTLYMIAHSSPNAKLLAIDTSVRGEWEGTKDNLLELLKLSRGGSTDLPRVLSKYDMKNSVILTDDDGWGQLNTMKIPPYLVIEIGTTKSIQKTIPIPEIWPERKTTIEINISSGLGTGLFFHFRE